MGACKQRRKPLPLRARLRELTAELERARKLLGEREQVLQELVNSFPGGVTMLDAEMRTIVFNARAKQLLDFPDWLFETGTPTLEDFFRFNALRGEYGPGDPEEQVSTRMALAYKRLPHVFERQRPDGTVLEIRGMPLDNGGFVTVYSDVTERVRAQAKIAHLAHHDALTDLPNRVMLRERMEAALAEATTDRRLALILLDLDRFKEVNDTLGHPVGDALLKAVAGRIRGCLMETDTAGRLGGDEFAVLHTVTDPATAMTVARRIQDALIRPFDLDGNHVEIGCSIGIAVAPDHGSEPDALMKHADVALYRAKSEGRSTYRLFEPAMVQDRLRLQRELDHALANDEFIARFLARYKANDAA